MHRRLTVSVMPFIQHPPQTLQTSTLAIPGNKHPRMYWVQNSVPLSESTEFWITVPCSFTPSLAGWGCVTNGRALSKVVHYIGEKGDVWDAAFGVLNQVYST
jgi:hypothetical protein